MVTISGNYGRTIYRDNKNGRTIFTLNTKDVKPNNIVCLGSCQMYPSDMPLKLDGEIRDGQFYFTECVPFVNTREKMVNFLSGKTFKGIGAKTAEKIYDFIDGNIFDYVMDECAEDKLREMFGSKIAKEIVVKVKSLSKVNRIYETISQYGGTITAAIKIGEVADVDTFMENVYEIGKLGGLSFGCCDGIARSIDYSAYSEQRIDALLAKTMSDITSSGHVYSNIKDITDKANAICKSSAYDETIPAPLLLSFAFKNKKYRIKEIGNDIRYYPTYLYNAENAVANGIFKLNQSSISLPFKEEIIEEIENECGIKYSDNQKDSFRLLKTSGVKILTGGPGTGKSTVINGIVKAIKKMFPDERPLLCAPTGRAAQRLKEVTGEDSFTIHKALNIMPYGEDFISTSPIDSKFIIVDEASMIDITLLQHLFEAISPSSFVLFCGDVEQLPSVGPGNALKDMIASNKIEVVTLNVVYRCLEDSLISYNAYKIKNCDTEVKTGKDFHFFSFKTEEEVKKKVEEIVMKNHDPNDPFKLQVLSPVKEGDIGTKSLNKSLQKICNGKTSEYAVFDSFKYKVSDKIIMTKNNYSDGYLNGDIGVVKEIDDKTITVTLGDDKEIVLKKSNMEDVAPAYALTVHKSQGSEFATVVVVLPEKPNCMLQKNLLYTAVTRAKKEVFIVAQNNAYEKAVKNTKIAERKTSLKEKIERSSFVYD